MIYSASLPGQDLSDIAGRWVGYIDSDGRELTINLTFSYSDNMLDGAINIPAQGAYALPVEVIDTSENKLAFQYETGKGPAVFSGNRDAGNDHITGEFSRAGKVFPFFLNRNRAPIRLWSGLQELGIIIPVNERKIGGSLTLREERSPLIILVSGSGSQDRNQNIGGFKTFQRLSSKLYEAGYSSFRYDDRGIGESTGNSDVTLQEMADDLVEIIKYLKSQYPENVSDVVLLGHNQGGLVASMAANESMVDGVVLAATPFLQGDKIITEQIKKISDVRDIPNEVVVRNLEFQEKVYDVVRSGSGWQFIEDELAERLEKQIRELPPEHQENLGDMSLFIQSQVDRQLETAKSRWFKSWIETDPVSLIEKLEAPVITIFGEKDTQVLPESNKNIADSLASEAGISIQTAVVAEANHLFQQANSGMPSEYGMLDPEFADGFVRTIDQFLESLQFVVPD